MNARSAARAIGSTVLTVLLLSACGDFSGQPRDCAERFTESALGVEGVTAAEFECGGTFGDPYQHGTVTLNVVEQKDALPVIADVYRAFAGNTKIDSSAGPVIEFISATSGKAFDEQELDFGGTPPVWEMRKRYCDDRECASGVTK